jgi:hypothetical protein
MKKTLIILTILFLYRCSDTVTNEPVYQKQNVKVIEFKLLDSSETINTKSYVVYSSTLNNESLAIYADSLIMSYKMLEGGANVIFCNDSIYFPRYDNYGIVSIEEFKKNNGFAVYSSQFSENKPPWLDYQLDNYKDSTTYRIQNQKADININHLRIRKAIDSIEKNIIKK